MIDDPTSIQFPVMILVSWLIFIGILRILLGGVAFRENLGTILFLAFICVVCGMFLGKYGATWGWPWWVYYPLPMLSNVFLPPWWLKLSKRTTWMYWVLSFMAAPLIHFFFVAVFGWHDYLPFL